MAATAGKGETTANVHCRGLSRVGDRFLGTFAFYDKQWATRRCYGFIWLEPAHLCLASPAYSHVVKLRQAPKEAGTTHRAYIIAEWTSFNTRVLHAAIVPPHLPHRVSAEIADFVAQWTHFQCNKGQSRAPLTDAIESRDPLVRLLRVPVYRTIADVFNECVAPLQQVRQVPPVSQAKDRSQTTLTSAATSYPGSNEVAAGFVLRDDSSTCLWLYRAAAVPALYAFHAEGVALGDLVGLADNVLFALDYLLHAPPTEALVAQRLEVLRKRQSRFFAECVVMRTSKTEAIKALGERVFAVEGAREIAVAAHISRLFADRATFANSAVDRVAWSAVAHATGYDKKTASDASLQLLAKRVGARIQDASFEPDARYLATAPHAFYTMTTVKLRRRVKEVRATIRNLGVAAFLPGDTSVQEVVADFTARHDERVFGAFAPLVVRTAADMRALLAMGAPGRVPPTSTAAVLILDAHMFSCEQFFLLFDVLERCWASLGVDVAQTQVELCGCAALCMLQTDGTGMQFLSFRFLFCDRLRYIADFDESPLPLLAARWLALADQKKLVWYRSSTAVSMNWLLVCAGRQATRRAMRTVTVARLAHEAVRYAPTGMVVCMALDEVKFMALDEFFTLMVVLHTHPYLTLMVLTETGAAEALPLERLQRGTALATHYPFPEEAVY